MADRKENQNVSVKNEINYYNSETNYAENHYEELISATMAGKRAGRDQVGVDSKFGIYGLQPSMTLTGMSVAGKGVGLNLSSSSTLINFSQSETSAFGFNISTNPYWDLSISRSPSAPLGGLFGFIPRKIGLTRVPPLVFNLTQAYNDGEDGTNIGSQWYVPDAADYEKVVSNWGASDGAYGAPPSILKRLGEFRDTINQNLQWVSMGADGIVGQTDFASPLGEPCNASELAKHGGTCSFSFSGGANQGFTFRSSRLHAFNFGGSTEHWFSPKREFWYDRRNVVAERMFQKINGSATWHFCGLPDIEGSLIKREMGEAVFASRPETEINGSNRSTVQYRYEGDMLMAGVRRTGAGIVDSSNIVEVEPVAGLKLKMTGDYNEKGLTFFAKCGSTLKFSTEPDGDDFNQLFAKMEKVLDKRKINLIAEDVIVTGGGNSVVIGENDGDSGVFIAADAIKAKIKQMQIAVEGRVIFDY